MARKRSNHGSDWCREAQLPVGTHRLLRAWCRLWGWSWSERHNRAGDVLFVELRRRPLPTDGLLRTGLWEQVAGDSTTGGMLWNVTVFHGPLPPRPLRKHLRF